VGDRGHIFDQQANKTLKKGLWGLANPKNSTEISLLKGGKNWQEEN